MASRVSGFEAAEVQVLAIRPVLVSAARRLGAVKNRGWWVVEVGDDGEVAGAWRVKRRRVSSVSAAARAAAMAEGRPASWDSS